MAMATLERAGKLYPLPSATTSRQQKKRTFSERKVFYKYLENGVTLRKKKGGGAGELFNMKNEDIYMA